MQKKLYDQVFCDSYEALELAYKDGLDKRNKIITSSPLLLTNKKDNCFNLEYSLQGNKLKKLQKSVYPFTLDVYKALLKNNFKSESLVSTISAINLTRLIRKAACLNSVDKKKKILIIRVDSNNKTLNEFINAEWIDILGSKNYEIKTYKINHPYEKQLKKQNYSYLQLINIYEWSNLAFFLIKRLAFLFPLLKKKRILLVFREDHLTREIVYNLFKKGIIPVFYKKKILGPSDYGKDSLEKLKKILYPIVSDYVKGWVCKEFQKNVIDYYFSNLKNNLDLKKSYKEYFSVYLKKFSQEILCITSYPAKIHTMALAEELNKRNIQLISTQHGINREINHMSKEGMCTWENGISDFLFVNNSESLKISQKSPFSRGQCLVVGTAKQLSAKKKINLFVGEKKIFYISTRLSTGNRMMLGGYLVDYEKAQQELKIINNVFKTIKKTIVFKTYPDLPFYLENDPVYEQVNRVENLELLLTTKDTQYYFNKMKLIITSRATSTLSWCILSNVPIVFINYDDQSMVKKNLEKEFEESLFYFNYSDKNFFKTLKKFLEKSDEEILMEWKSKEVKRKRFIDRYFSSAQKKTAGQLASDFIIKNNLFKKI